MAVTFANSLRCHASTCFRISEASKVEKPLAVTPEFIFQSLFAFR